MRGEKKKLKYIYISLLLVLLPIILHNSMKMNISKRNLDETICTIYTIFEESRTCTIDKTTIDQDIINGLKGSESSSYYEYLSNSIFQDKNEATTKEDNEIISIGKLESDEKINLGECGYLLRINNNISFSETFIIYKHQYNVSNYKTPVIGFELFFNQAHLNTGLYCSETIVFYYIQVEIEDNELYKYNKSNEYYSDDCEPGDLSLYDRKKEYNDKNLSLCQKDCNFTDYNPQTKIVTCSCLVVNTNININEELFHKFELLEEDKHKCIITTTTNQVQIPTTEKIDISTTSKAHTNINIVSTDKNNNIKFTYNNDNIKITEDIEQLFFEGFINNIISNKTGKEKESAFEDIITEIMNGSLSNLIDQVVNNQKDFVMVSNGDSYHLSTIKMQFKQEELSAVDLGPCEDTLRQTFGLGDQELLIFKVDHEVPGFKIPIIEYVLLTQDGRINIDLNICKDIPVNYLIPVNISTDKLYLYDPNNEFYNDLCNQHTSESGTDMTLFDRKNDYNIQNMSLCESGCEYEGYNATTKKTKCSCPIKTQRNFFDIDQDKLLNKFKNYKDMINIMIIKCYKLVFSSNGIKTNIGSYIVISIAVINSILIIVFYIKGFAQLKNTMIDILNKSFKNDKNQNFPPKKEKEKEKHKKKRKSKDYKRKSTVKNMETKENILTEEKKLKRKKSIGKKETIHINDVDKVNEKNEMYYMNDYELNSLKYDLALQYDKRNYWEYYISLIKTKELIVFTFFTNTDYNSRMLKIILFLLSFTLFYTVNALFFNDSTMHQIYEDEGEFNFIYQIPQILYSTIISTVIKVIISFLSLTESNLAKIKSLKTKKLALEELNKILKCISKKCIIFFSLSFLLLIIFWYYLASFCAVYKNTQVYLIKDTLISFSTSLLYPFVINLFPGMLRFPAIKSKKKYLFIVSYILSLI